MRFIFTADVHGNKTQYQKVFNYAVINHIRTIILGGDITPKNPELRNPAAQKAFLRDYLFELIQSFPGQVLIILGNDDYKSNSLFLEENQEKIGYKLLGEAYQTEEFYFVGYSYVPYTPYVWKDWERRDLKTDNQNTLRDYVKTEGFMDHDTPYSILPEMMNHSIEEDLDRLTQNIPTHKLVLVTHAPPYQTNTDFTKDKHSGIFHHVGSSAVKKIIEQKQPLLTLHGHIHDSVPNTGVFPDKIGKTICASVSNDHLPDNPFILDIELSDCVNAKRIELK